jgi:hypothetical protein
MDEQTLDITILLAGLLSLRICSSWMFIIIERCVSIKLSRICLLARNMQTRLFKILDTKDIFLEETMLPIAIIYSFCGMPSIYGVRNYSLVSWRCFVICSNWCKRLNAFVILGRTWFVCYLMHRNGNCNHIS